MYPFLYKNVKNTKEKLHLLIHWCKKWTLCFEINVFGHSEKSEICIQIRSLKITNPQSLIDELIMELNIGIIENLPNHGIDSNIIGWRKG